MSVTAHIVCDVRERAAGVAELLRQDPRLTVEERTLEVGDYVVTEELGVERKTAHDFVRSIIDGRLFSQARRLKKCFPRAVMIIEGPDLFTCTRSRKKTIDESAPSTMTRIEKEVVERVDPLGDLGTRDQAVDDLDRFAVSGMSREAIEGALASLAVCWQLPFVCTQGQADTARFLTLAALQLARQAAGYFLHDGGSKPKRLSNRKLRILQALPGIGPALAQELLAHFSSVRQAFAAGEEELLAVRGIGKGKAAGILRTISERRAIYG